MNYLSFAKTKYVRSILSMTESGQYKVRAKVWKCPGFAGWHFVYVGKKETEKIKALRAGTKRRGWGSVPVTVTVGKSTWDTSIFPSKEDPYLLAIKAEVRKKEGIYDRDVIVFSFRILNK